MIPTCLYFPETFKERVQQWTILSRELFSKLHLIRDACSDADISDLHSEWKKWENWTVSEEDIPDAVAKDIVERWINAFEFSFGTVKKQKDSYVGAVSCLFEATHEERRVPVLFAQEGKRGLALDLYGAISRVGKGEIWLHPDFEHRRSYLKNGDDSFANSITQAWNIARENSRVNDSHSLFWGLNSTNGDDLHVGQLTGSSASGAAVRLFWHLLEGYEIDSDVFVLADCTKIDGKLARVEELNSKVSKILEYHDERNSFPPTIIVASDLVRQDEQILEHFRSKAYFVQVDTIDELLGVRSFAAKVLIEHLSFLEEFWDETPWNLREKKLKISEVFVPPKFKFEESAADADKSGSEDELTNDSSSDEDRDGVGKRSTTRTGTKSHTLDEILGREREKALLFAGDAGDGKTTILRRCARNVAIQARSQLESKECGDHKLPWPFFSDCYLWAKSDQNRASELADVILSQLNVLPGCDPSEQKFLQGFYQRRITDSTQNTVLFLDGLDQVPERYVPTFRSKLQTLKFDPVNIILTCRRGYSSVDAANLPFEFDRVESMGLLSVDIPKLAVNILGKEIGRKLIIHLEQEDEYREFLQNPLLLTLLCLLHRSSPGSLPRNRAELLTKISVAISKGVWRGIDTNETFLSPETLLEEARNLAWNLRRLAIDEHRFEERTVLSQINRGPDKQIVLDALVRVGFLDCVSNNSHGKEFQFPHSTFQDFLAAWHISLGINNRSLNDEDFTTQKLFKLLDLQIDCPRSENFIRSVGCLLDDPVPLVMWLSAKQNNDITLRRVHLATEIIRSVDCVEKPKLEEVRDKLANRLFRLLMSRNSLVERLKSCPCPHISFRSRPKNFSQDLQDTWLASLGNLAKSGAMIKGPKGRLVKLETAILEIADTERFLSLIRSLAGTFIGDKTWYRLIDLVNHQHLSFKWEGIRACEQLRSARSSEGVARFALDRVLQTPRFSGRGRMNSLIDIIEPGESLPLNRETFFRIVKVIQLHDRDVFGPDSGVVKRFERYLESSEGENAWEETLANHSNLVEHWQLIDTWHSIPLPQTIRKLLVETRGRQVGWPAKQIAKRLEEFNESYLTGLLEDIDQERLQANLQTELKNGDLTLEKHPEFYLLTGALRVYRDFCILRDWSKFLDLASSLSHLFLQYGFSSPLFSEAVLNATYRRSQRLVRLQIRENKDCGRVARAGFMRALAIFPPDLFLEEAVALIEADLGEPINSHSDYAALFLLAHIGKEGMTRRVTAKLCAMISMSDLREKRFESRTRRLIRRRQESTKEIQNWTDENKKIGEKISFELATGGRDERRVAALKAISDIDDTAIHPRLVEAIATCLKSDNNDVLKAALSFFKKTQLGGAEVSKGLREVLKVCDDGLESRIIEALILREAEDRSGDEHQKLWSRLQSLDSHRYREALIASASTFSVDHLISILRENFRFVGQDTKLITRLAENWVRGNSGLTLVEGFVKLARIDRIRWENPITICEMVAKELIGAEIHGDLILLDLSMRDPRDLMDKINGIKQFSLNPARVLLAMPRGAITDPQFHKILAIWKRCHTFRNSESKRFLSLVLWKQWRRTSSPESRYLLRRVLFSVLDSDLLLWAREFRDSASPFGRCLLDLALACNLSRRLYMNLPILSEYGVQVYPRSIGKLSIPILFAPPRIVWTY